MRDDHMNKLINDFEAAANEKSLLRRQIDITDGGVEEIDRRYKEARQRLFESLKRAC